MVSMSMLIVILLVLLASSLFGVEIGLIIFIQDLVFIGFVVDVTVFWSWQSLFQLLNLLSLKLAFLGELHVEFDKEVSVAHFVVEEWHTVVPDQFGLSVANDLPRHGSDLDGPSVQMLHIKGETRQRFQKCDRFFHEEVSSFTFENWVLFDQKSDMQIASHDIRGLMGLSNDDVVVLVRNTFLNSNFNRRFFFYNFITFARITSFLNGLALTAATRTGRNSLLVHSWA